MMNSGKNVRRVKIIFRNGKILDAACTFSHVVIAGGKLDRLNFITDAGTLLLSGAQVLRAVEYYARPEVG